jgi:hypothetical protein
MHTLSSRALLAVVAGLGVALGGIIAAGALSASAQPTTCTASGAPPASSSTATGHGGPSISGPGGSLTAGSSLGPSVGATTPSGPGSPTSVSPTTGAGGTPSSGSPGSGTTAGTGGPLISLTAPTTFGVAASGTTPASAVGAPLEVAAGPNAGSGLESSLLALSTPIDANGFAPLTNGASTSTNSSTGPLVALQAPVSVGSTTLTTPVSSVMGSAALIGPTPGPGTLVSVAVPANITSGAGFPSSVTSTALPAA